MPRLAASTVASVAAAAPRKSELRVPQTTCDQMSVPWSVVPKKWFQEGDCFASSSE